jgi:hypothetical protein
MLYNYTALHEFCEKNKITLGMDYTNVKVNVFTTITGNCLQENCINKFSKIFRALVKNNGYCSSCSRQNGYIKCKQTSLERYGVDNPNKKQEIIDKIKKTRIEKYGDKFSLQNKAILEKRKKTNLERYGVEYSGQIEESKAKSKQTCLIKYGVEYPSQSEEFREKCKQNWIKKYGLGYSIQTEESKAKSKQTCLIKYGVEHPNQNIEIMEKNSKNAYKLKEYVYPSGKIVQVQGTEPIALDYLIEQELIHENDIVVGARNVPTIWYFDEAGKKHRHYVDIFIPSKNLCIECKSTWTLKKKEDNIFLKQNAAKELGYNYEIWVYDGKGKLVEKHI